MRRSVAIALILSLMPFSTSPSSATPCYVVVSGVLTDGSACSGDVVIEEGITAIGQYNGGYGAFQLSGVTSVTIPASVETIMYGAFWDRTGLTSVTFAPGSTLTSIDQFAFSGTQNLKSITLPSSLISIGSTAFSGSGILYITFEGPAPVINNYNGPGDLQGVSSSAIAWVKPSNLASFNAVTPKILPTVRSISGNTPPPTIFWPSNNETITATVGSAFTDSITYVGVGNPVLDISSGSLPPGISLNASTGVISGTPTTTLPLMTRIYSVSLRVSDGSESDTVAITFEVLPPPLPQIYSATYTGIAGVPMNKLMSVSASGAATVTVSEGALPPGISISGTNRLIGTPTTTGNYTAKLRVTDSYSQVATSTDFIFEITSAISVSISASLQVMNPSTSPDQPSYSVISTNAPDDFVICGFFRDAAVVGSPYSSPDCSLKQSSGFIANGITSDVAYTELNNTSWVVRAYGPDSLEQGMPDINTPFLASVTVIVGEEAQPPIQNPTQPTSSPSVSPSARPRPSITPSRSVTPSKAAISSYAAKFSAGSSAVTNTGKTAIKKIVKKAGKDAKFTVTGVAGKSIGVPDSKVKALAKARAEKIKAYLIKLGVKKSNIIIKIKIIESGITPKTKILAMYLTS